ncbi:MAG: hypothetical protein WD512_20895, partial [Candidatus Paceibacterota bacterium]
ASYTFKKSTIGGDFFILNADPFVRTISSTSSGVINQNDLQLVQSSGATTITDYAVSIQPLIPGTYNTTIYSNNSGVILAPNEFGIASGIASGSTSLVATSSEDSFSTIKVVVSGVTGAVSITFNDYAANSLAKEVSDAVDTRINGLNATTAKPIYTTQNHTTPTYVRNTNCWVADLDLTSISPWNSTEGTNRAGVLISPRHILFAAHYQINNGSTVRFIDSDNNIVTRTMINKLTHPNYAPYYPDITIGILDSDVPSSISFVKILPQNWSDYLPSLSSTYRLSCLVLDQEEKALISDLYSLDTYARFLTPVDPTRLGFFESIILGDSGNPAFLIIDDELVIITVWTFGGAGAGTSILYHKDAINTMMASLGGGYSLTEIDLSSFTDFS